MRNTQQREALHHAIEAAKRPLAIAEIYEVAAKRLPKLGIATVYREVRRLHAQGTLARVDIPGETAPRYEITPTHAEHHHHHFKCEACGQVFDVDACGLKMENLLPPGFTHRAHELVIFGQCKGCAG